MTTEAIQQRAPETSAERQAKLIREDGFMCEQHTGEEFEHDTECAGPGMPWMIEGKSAIAALLTTEHQRGVDEERKRIQQIIQDIGRDVVNGWPVAVACRKIRERIGKGEDENNEQ